MIWHVQSAVAVQRWLPKELAVKAFHCACFEHFVIQQSSKVVKRNVKQLTVPYAETG
eukprot:CAMPEP_0203896582 /NCGR_PEP_ID=MMETSP0359-20131031/39304_1 /ASSEMBLY_ACC=CAM_ASM_000338 /TAXON_ID=268821 /ORGANISM="Scrippsiella Hangoei, Strain SHTV-5" /LENGTH=56 /DNA_ID=CAMNT_0050819275 /DNA_START=242 /DNA_END=412 /DNA_ORIENTATION=-